MKNDNGGISVISVMTVGNGSSMAYQRNYVAGASIAASA